MAAVGIDLGTTFSVLSWANGKTVKFAQNELGSEVTPSMVWFGKNVTDVGKKAQDHRVDDANNVIYQVKRVMGIKATDENLSRRNFPYEIICGKGGRAKIRVSSPGGGPSEEYFPEEVSAVILAHLKKQAEIEFNRLITKAVITVPASFKEAQRQATIDAGLIAGFKEVKLVNEPTAAAIAYGFDKYRNNDNKERVVLVYDLGGGTFDVSIVKIKGLNAEVLASVGLQDLGGEDFDNIMVEHILGSVNSEVSESDRWKLKAAAENAKKELSRRAETKIDVTLNDGKPSANELVMGITRKEFETMCEHLFEKTRTCIDEALSQAKVDKAKLDDVVLVGGSVRIPYIKELIRNHFTSNCIRNDIHPDEAVAQGAAYLAASLFGEGPEIKLTDVTSFALGIALVNDVFDPIIEANSKIPSKIQKPYETVYDNQDNIEITIHEGSRPIASQNPKLDSFTLKDIPKRKAGEVKIDVSFDLDANGILKVFAVERSSTKRAGIKVLSGKRTEEEVLRMIDNAARRAQQDAEEKDRLCRLTKMGRRINDLKRAIEKKLVKDPRMANAVVEKEEKWLADNRSATAREIQDHIAVVDAAFPAGMMTVRQQMENASLDQ